jgi:hypothetical protein
MRASGPSDRVGCSGEGVESRVVCVCEVHCINVLSTVYEGGNDRTKSPEPRWVFDVTPCEDGIKAKQLTLWEGESADLLFVAPWSLTPAKEVL